MSSFKDRLDKESPQQLGEFLERAEGVRTCAWAVMSAPRLNDGKRQLILMFYDRSGRDFVHAFSFDSMEEIQLLCHRLVGMQTYIDRGGAAGIGMPSFN